MVGMDALELRSRIQIVSNLLGARYPVAVLKTLATLILGLGNHSPKP